MLDLFSDYTHRDDNAEQALEDWNAVGKWYFAVLIERNQ